jgi:trehalose 6-phosphate phosphatase
MTDNVHLLRDVLDTWEDIREAVTTANHLFILSDFDGSLAPTSETPPATTIDPDVSMVLHRLCRHDRVTLAVLSGRTIDDLKSRIDLPVILVGDNGLEIHGGDFRYTAPGSDSIHHEVSQICECLQEAARHIPGSCIEAKRLSASVHYRHVIAEHPSDLKCAVHACVDPSRYEIHDGKSAMEIRPRLIWNKGDAAEWILNYYGARQEHVICLGGDKSDQYIFRRLPNAIKIQVGFDGLDLGADYWLPQPEVAQFFLRILNHLVATASGLLDQDKEHMTASPRKIYTASAFH